MILKTCDYNQIMSENNSNLTNKEQALKMKKFRLSLGMTTREFAKLFGRSHSTIVQWENCNTIIPEIAIKLFAAVEKEYTVKLRRRERIQSQSL